MKAPRRWIVRRLGEQPCELYFREGIDRESLQQIYPGCHVAPAPLQAAPSDNREEADDDDS